MTHTPYHITPFTAQDYPGIIKLHNKLEPEYPLTEQELRHWESTRDAKLFFKRFIVKHQQRVIAQISAGHDSWQYHPQKFSLDLKVHPEHQRRGLGTALYAHMLQYLRPQNPLLFRSRVREDKPAGRAFLAARGFSEEDREWESHLDPVTVQFDAYEGLIKKLAAEGIHLMSVRDLMTHDPEYRRKLYEIETGVGADAPQPDAATSPSFESWQKNVFDAPTFLPDGYLVAVKNNEYLAVNSFWALSNEPDAVLNGLTGVKRQWRKKGLATALKIQNLKWAKQQGYTRIKTWNNASNKDMLRINEKLGFQKRPAWISYKHTLNPTLEQQNESS